MRRNWPRYARKLSRFARKRERGPAASAPTAAAEDAAGPLGARIDQVKELIAAMQGVIESAESSVSVHPIAGVAAAFLAGLLIGRATKFG